MLFRPDEHRRIKKMLATNRIELLTVAKRIRDNYANYFVTDHNINILPYRHVVPKQFHRVLTAHDFTKKIKFVLPGTIIDGRKGQLPIFYAFVQFYEHYYKPNPKAYRDFELVVVGISTDFSTDFLSRQLLAHEQALKGHFTCHPTVPWNQCLAIISQANMTVCYSLREGLPLFVFEGMIAGHPILRNDCSGMEEQLKPGVNGWYLETSDFQQVVRTLESVLNKAKTSDAKLAGMSKASYDIAKKQETNDYLSRIETF